jgi:mono/diheme cytochrome c family protein
MKSGLLAASFMFICSLMTRCTNETENKTQNAKTTSSKTDTVVLSQGSNSKGIGRFKEVSLTHPLDEAMISKAQVIYNAKCFACHKLTTEKLVGPGWKGVTDRRTPEWILNFITNTEVMLDKDLVAQSDLVTCVVRMPSQGLTDEQARQMLEFMRKNDGKN